MTQFPQLQNQDDMTEVSSDLQWAEDPADIPTWAVRNMPAKSQGVETSSYSTLPRQTVVQVQSRHISGV